jgi:hypothetical protein
MGPQVSEALRNALMITAFVAVMMIAVEYLNILTRGTFESALRGSPPAQYLAAALLGALPGCLGAFTVVTLYAHRVVTVGAVVACMIATSGDEMFVMLAMVPRTALWMTAGMFALGLASAPIVDRLAGAARYASDSCPGLEIHPEECECFPRGHLLRQWSRPNAPRLLLTVGAAGYAAWIAVGGRGLPEAWNPIRVTILLAALFGAFIVATVPDHFLQQHLWRHVVRRHVPRIFAWTAGVLLAIAVLEDLVSFQAIVRANPWPALAAAGMIGLVPESGPHLVFVTLYASGSLPLSVLAASSIVQDGHGMLPLLAESPRDFLRVKLVNLAVGLVVGAVLLAGGI